MKMEQTDCSETSAYQIQTPGNYQKESIQHSEHGESLKSKICLGCVPKKRIFGGISLLSHKVHDLVFITIAYRR